MAYKIKKLNRTHIIKGEGKKGGYYLKINTTGLILCWCRYYKDMVNAINLLVNP